MTLFNKIKNYLILQVKQECLLKDLYEHFDDIKPSTIRGRINENKGKEILRIGKGRYILVSDEVEAIVEQTDCRYAIPNILASLMYYDMIFLDIPYRTSGQRSGNRNILTYDLIDVEEFEKIALNVQKMLRHDDSPIYFMIAGGKSSKKDALNYLSAFGPTNLKVAGRGSYTKLTSNGKIANMGKYQIPAEEIYVYSHSGKLIKPSETQLDFTLERAPLPKSGGYPTQKPLSMLKKIVEQSTNIGDSILDFFAGSGVTMSAALELSRKCHCIDIADESMKKMKQILQKYESRRSLILDSINNSSYSKKQLEIFSGGNLF